MRIYNSLDKSKDNDSLKVGNLFQFLRKYIYIIIITFILVITMIGFYLLIQNVGIVHSFLFPEYRITLNKENNDWENVEFLRGSFFKFDSIFYDKLMINDANSVDTMEISILDDQDIVIEQFTLNPGESHSLKFLKNNKDYKIRVLAEKGQYFLNIT